jgi:aerobic-type carbon monoxide dehydrogenase small subunit (CoxS/CutS family)
MATDLQFTLNGQPRQLTLAGERTLLWVLRTDFGLTGAKVGCGEGHCGACTVLVDGRPVRACQASAASVAGKAVLTIEGLAGADGTLHPVQAAFVRHDALQCGFCTPGMILAAVGLLSETPKPSRQQVLAAMDDNLCRCGAHVRILAAIDSAAAALGGEGAP